MFLRCETIEGGGLGRKKKKEPRREQEDKGLCRRGPVGNGNKTGLFIERVSTNENGKHVAEKEFRKKNNQKKGGQGRICGRKSIGFGIGVQGRSRKGIKRAQKKIKDGACEKELKKGKNNAYTYGIKSAFGQKKGYYALKKGGKIGKGLR